MTNGVPTTASGADDAPDVSDKHWNVVVPRLLQGKVVVFLGAGVNLSIRPPREKWSVGRYLPSGAELSDYLAEQVSYEGADRHDLLRVSQYVALVEGSAPLYEHLGQLLDVDYPATPVHELLAALPSQMRAQGTPRRYPLFVTTNYDDVLERALSERQEPFDLVWYVADGEKRGKFWHTGVDGTTQIIETPNEYLAVSPELRPVVLKIHGNVDRTHSERDSYVITEDHYIDYLTRTEVSSLLPVMLAKTLNTSYFLFLGYSLRDWNLRVILHRIWGQQKLSYNSWAVQRQPTELDRRYWAQRNVEVLDCELRAYAEDLARRCRYASAKDR
ncbi:MAG: SIR2 family protein [Polyangiaceae bacterium]|nr:SIR2 family protein [Polyangiaceae bacterium]